VLWEGTGKQEGPEFSTDDADTILESYARRATCQWGLGPRYKPLPAALV